MQREIVVKLSIPRSPRARWLAAVALFVTAVSVTVYATVPNMFAAGDTLSAAKLNDNFTQLDGRVTELETKLVVTRNGKKFSIGAIYCGQTATTAGQVTGTWAGAKTLCEAACSSTSAHFCSNNELVRSAQVGVTLATGWLADGANGDCNGFSSSTNAFGGTIWNVATGTGGSAGCDQVHPLLCCD